jgi:hypothetical protein
MIGDDTRTGDNSGAANDRRSFHHETLVPEQAPDRLSIIWSSTRSDGCEKTSVS